MRRLYHTLKRALTLARIAWLSRRLLRERDAEERLLARRALADLLAQARGVAMKVGQAAASLGDDAELQRLILDIEPRPLDEMLPAIERGLGRPPAEVFDTLEPSRAAASLGQVHRATLRDGTVVAVKVRYPDIAAAVRSEMELAGLLPGAGPLRVFHFDLEAYKRMLATNMERELDYRSEAARQEVFGTAVQVDGLVVPKTYQPLCGDGILVQSWEDGVTLREAAAWPHRDRLLIARTLIETVFVSLFAAGEVHGDPNPGNYLFRHGKDGRPRVVLLDYGCTVPFARDRRLALLRLILDARGGAAAWSASPAHAAACLVAAGFEAEKLVPILRQLPAVCQALLTPFLDDRPGDGSLSQRLEELLGDLRWWFRSSGPPDSLLLMRIFQGLVDQLHTLDVDLPWWPLLERSVGAEMLAEARAFEPPPLPRDLLAKVHGLEPRATLLEVRATEGDEEVLALSLPALEVLNLPTLVPEEARRRLAAAGTDLEDLVDEIKAGGIRPQEVLVYVDDRRVYRVWLA